MTLIRSHVVSWKLPSASIANPNEINPDNHKDQYKLEMKLSSRYLLESQNVSANLTYGNDVIGKLYGHLLPRPAANFHELGDEISEDLQFVTCLFCDRNGDACRIETDLEGDDIYSGGFFYVDEVKVKKAHRGNDLGLRILHETMEFLRGDWNIAVMVCVSLQYDSKDELGTEDDHDIVSRNVKVQRHFARMGFKQAARNVDECHVWHMTSDVYFGYDEEVEPSTAMDRWKTKEEAERLDLYVPPRTPKIEGVDKELHDVVMNFCCGEVHDVISQVQDLVQNGGASIHRSRAMMLLASNELATYRNTMTQKAQILSLLQTLICLGADVNATDEHGYAPLHFAASFYSGYLIRALVDAGADVNSLNARGQTPLQTLLHSWRKLQDYTIIHDFRTVWPSRLNPKIESILSLLPKETCELFIDDWLSPRMMKVFEVKVDGIVYNFLELNIDLSQRLIPLSNLSKLKMKIEFIPFEDILNNEQSIDRKFIEGWGIIWMAIARALHKKKAPTITRVRQEIKAMDNIAQQIFGFFERTGGKIDHALDALVWISRDAVSDLWDFGLSYALEELPETLFDHQFDLAKMRLLEIDDTRSNVLSQPKGPYPQSNENYISRSPMI